MLHPTPSTDSPALRRRPLGLLRLTAGLLLASTLGCASAPTMASAPLGGTGDVYVPPVPVSHPPFDDVIVSWFMTLEQPYVYVDHIGSYTDTRSFIPMLLSEVHAQGLTMDGAPFCLFYDDAEVTPVADLRSRACVPIKGPTSPVSPLQYDVLPSRTNVVSAVSGPYTDVTRAYPAMNEYMRKLNFVADGPIRESYLVQPNHARSEDDLLCEIRVPVRSAAR